MQNMEIVPIDAIPTHESDQVMLTKMAYVGVDENICSSNDEVYNTQ